MIVPPPAGERWYAVPKGERVLKFDAPSVRGDGGGFAADFKECVSLLPVTCPPPFRGWVVSAARRKGAASPWATLWPGFRGFRPPSGSAPGSPGSAHRAGWFRGEFYMPPAAAGKPYNRPDGRGNGIPLWWLAPPPFRPAGKRVTGFSVAYGSLRIQFPCHRKRGHYNPCLL